VSATDYGFRSVPDFDALVRSKRGLLRKIRAIYLPSVHTTKFQAHLIKIYIPSNMTSPTATAQQVQEKLGYQFTSSHLLLEALKAAGAGFDRQHSARALDGNKRLAQVGSAVLKTILADEWYNSGEGRGTLKYDFLWLKLTRFSFAQ
jgi:hypothetical protein